MVTKISLSQFIDFTLKQTMTAKINKVNQLKKNNNNLFLHSHWKDFKDCIKYSCENTVNSNFMDELLANIHPQKYNSYKDAILSFKKLVKDKNVTWFDPPKSYWSYQNKLLVTSDADLGLYIDKQAYLFKFIYKEVNENVTKRNIQPALSLMINSESEFSLPQDCIICFLNLKNCRIFYHDENSEDILISLKYEALSFLNIWNEIENL